MPNTKAAAYIRMSTSKQEDSPVIQRANILAKFGGDYEIIAWYSDLGKSGSKNKELRTDFLKMLKDSASSEWKAILCNNPARFTREDTIAAASDKQILRDNGITVVTVTDGAMDWSTFAGRLVDAVQAEANNQYPITLAKNTLDGKIKKAKEGKSFGQTTPYGLARLITDSLGNHFEVSRTTRYTKPKDAESVFTEGDSEEVEIVRWLFSEFLRRDVSFHQLAKELNQKNVKSPTGKTWVYEVVHQILKNPRYAGDLTLGRRSSGRFYRVGSDAISVEQPRKMKMHTNLKPAVHIRNAHAHIIEREAFDAVQVKLARRTRTRKHSPKEGGFALTGVILCGKCGKVMYGNERKDAARHRVGVKYSCKGWHRSFEAGCGQWMVHQDDVLPLMVDVLKREIDETILAKAEAQPPNMEKVNTVQIEKKLTKLKSEYETACKRFLTLPEDHPAEADLDAAIRSQKVEITQLERELAQPAEDVGAWLSRRKEFWNGIKARLLHIEDPHFAPADAQPFQSGSGGFGRLVRTRPLTPDTIRELLHSIGARLTLWFDRATRADGTASKKWIVVKARLTTESGFSESIHPTELNTPASLIV